MPVDMPVGDADVEAVDATRYEAMKTDLWLPQCHPAAKGCGPAKVGSVCIHICVNLCGLDMCVNMCLDMCIDMRTNICMGM